MSKSRRQAGQEFCKRTLVFLFQQHLLLQPKGAEGRDKSEGEEENGGANNVGEKATGCTSGTGEADTELWAYQIPKRQEPYLNNENMTAEH